MPTEVCQGQESTGRDDGFCVRSDHDLALEVIRNLGSGCPDYAAHLEGNVFEGLLSILYSRRQLQNSSFSDFCGKHVTA